jgi:surface antigen
MIINLLVTFIISIAQLINIMGWTVRTQAEDLKSANSCPKVYVKQGYSNGVSPCILGNNNPSKGIARPFYGCVLPNCVGYAVGRSAEGVGSLDKCYLNSMNAYLFWENQPSDWKRSKTPKEGAVCVWNKSSNLSVGHVAIVESVIDSKTIMVSESNWSSGFFNYKKVTPSTRFSNTDFLGYLINPYTDTPEEENEYEWKYKKSYLDFTQELMENNAVCFASKMYYEYGVTLNAIAGMLGNIHAESRINPWSWEGDNYGVESKGYGLIQWTPSTVLTDEASKIGRTDKDTGDCQTEVIYRELDGTITGVWLKNSKYGHYMKPDEFLASTESPEELALVYLFSRERPYDPSATQEKRQKWAREWYNFLIEEGLPYVGPDPNDNYRIYLKKSNWIYYQKAPYKWFKW